MRINAKKPEKYAMTEYIQKKLPRVVSLCNPTLK